MQGFRSGSLSIWSDSGGRWVLHAGAFRCGFHLRPTHRIEMSGAMGELCTSACTCAATRQQHCTHFWRQERAATSPVRSNTAFIPYLPHSVAEDELGISYALTQLLTRGNGPHQSAWANAAHAGAEHPRSSLADVGCCIPAARWWLWLLLCCSSEKDLQITVSREILCQNLIQHIS